MKSSASELSLRPSSLRDRPQRPVALNLPALENYGTVNEGGKLARQRLVSAGVNWMDFRQTLHLPPRES